MSEIGDRIKEARKKAGISQIDLAKTIGMTQQALSMLERGDTGSSKKLVDIAEALDVSAHWLANGSDLDDEVTHQTSLKKRLDILEVELSVVRELNSRILLEIISLRAEVKDLKKGGAHSK